ncbi:MAG: glycosyltransferase family 39 protein [Acidobacteriaceae bacterium]
MASTDRTPKPSSPFDGSIFFPTAIAVLFCCVTLLQAHVKLLWGDEFVTFWIGRQRSFAGIWGALEAGTDPNPPLMHVLNWWSTSLLGTGPIAIRLPSILGMGLGLVCLWVFLRRRFAPVYAAAGCLALMATRGFDYAYDARSYSLLMGFAMAAVLLWSLSVEAQGARRVGLLVGLAVALAAGLSSNYYGALAFFPIAVGELRLGFATSPGTEKWRVGAWVAMVVASLPLLAYLPLIRLDVAEYGPHAWDKPRISMVSDSYLVIVEGILWPVLGLLAYTLWRGRRREVESRFPVWERAAVGVLIAYPVLGFLVGLCGRGMLSARCAVAVCLGVAILGAGLLARCAKPRTALLVVGVLCVWVVAREAVCGIVLVHQRHAFFRLLDAVEQTAAPGEPVVVGDSLVVFPLYRYGSAALRQQIVFPVDFEAIDRIERDDSGERDMWSGRNGVFPVTIAAPAELLGAREERVVVASPKGWVARDLEARGYALTEPANGVPWEWLGGVFTPLEHEETRILLAAPM